MSNFKNVLKVYTMMRAFDADDTALLNTLRGASEAEIELLVETVGPVKPVTAKRARKSNKSTRAASLAEAIQGAKRGLNALRCATCDAIEINAIHDPTAGYAGYHPFQSVVTQAAAGGD